VLVIPFRISDTGPVYAIFKRNASTGGYWQWIAGGGEDTETPAQSALREAEEEAGIRDAPLVPLTSTTTIPVVAVVGFAWGDETLVIPEYSFGVEVKSEDLSLSGEHTEFLWVPYAEATALLHWDSNVNALWELDYRLRQSLSVHV
jgi:dATP pyrophosphohydrolase